MSYVIRISPMARSQIMMLDSRLRKRVYVKLTAVQEDPYRHVERLHGNPLYKARVGNSLLHNLIFRYERQPMRDPRQSCATNYKPM